MVLESWLLSAFGGECRDIVVGERTHPMGEPVETCSKGERRSLEAGSGTRHFRARGLEGNTGGGKKQGSPPHFPSAFRNNISAVPSISILKDLGGP